MMAFFFNQIIRNFRLVDIDSIIRLQIKCGRNYGIYGRKGVKACRREKRKKKHELTLYQMKKFYPGLNWKYLNKKN